jgi:hypothetical protein
VADTKADPAVVSVVDLEEAIWVAAAVAVAVRSMSPTFVPNFQNFLH